MFARLPRLSSKSAKIGFILRPDVSLSDEVSSLVARCRASETERVTLRQAAQRQPKTMSSLPAVSCLVAAIDVDGRWTPGIGDPTLVGWVTVALYLIASGMCVLWARPTGPGRALPVAVAALMMLLAINKQLDLQSLFTEVARSFVKSQGWSENRRDLQFIFIVGILAASIVVLGGLAWLHRDRWREVGVALLGLVCLSGFVVVRAASFHRVDQFLGGTLGGLKFNWILELGGISMVFGGAIIGWLSRRSKGPNGPKGPKLDLELAEPIEPAASPVETLALKAAATSKPKSTPPMSGFVVRPIRISPGPPHHYRRSDQSKPSSSIAI